MTGTCRFLRRVSGDGLDCNVLGCLDSPLASISPLGIGRDGFGFRTATFFKNDSKHISSSGTYRNNLDHQFPVFYPPQRWDGWQKTDRDSAHCSNTRTGLKSVTQKGKEWQSNLFLYKKEGVVPTYKRMHYTILV